MSAVPQAVRNQGKRASEIQASLNTPPTQQDPPAAPAPAAPAEPKPPAPQAQPAAKSDEDGKWRQRYDVLKGKYDAEVPQLNRRVRELEEQVEQLKTQPQAPVAPAPEARPQVREVKDGEIDIKALFTDAEIEDFGEDTCKMMAKVALRQSERTVAQAVKPAVEEADKRAKASFWKQLRELCPDWEAVNVRSNWREWLAQPDPKTGTERQRLLSAAQQRLDAEAVAAFFTEFKGTPAFAKGDTDDDLDTDQEDLQRQQLPETTPGGNPPPTPNKATFNASEITQFYDEKRRGLWKGREDDARAKEQDFALAAKEGRVIRGR